jgi:hypothetical protein
MKISGINGISVTQRARFGLTACSATVWLAASSVVCKVPMGSSTEGVLPAVVTAGLPYTIQDALEYDTYFSIKHNFISQDFIFIQGKNFGAYDISQKYMIAEYGCKLSAWISDTTVKCSLNPGFAASGVTDSAVQDLKICVLCTFPQIIDGCEKGISQGTCAECQACPAGEERVPLACIVRGELKRGKCEPCKAGTYKESVGFPNSMCILCKVCGLMQCETEVCTATKNAECANCNRSRCVPPDVSAGCEGSSPGNCVDGNIVSQVTGTTRVRIEGIHQLTDDGNGQLLTNQIFHSTLTGMYSEVSLTIPAGVLITLHGGTDVSDCCLSTVNVGSDLIDAATGIGVPIPESVRRRSDLQDTGASSMVSRSLRRSENGLEFGILGPVILLTPSQTTSYPAVAITLPFNRSNINRDVKKQRLAIYHWNERVNQWTEVPVSTEIRDGVLAASTSTFGIFTVIAVPTMTTAPSPFSSFLVKLKDHGEFISPTELVMKETVIASAEGPCKETGIHIPKGTLATLLKAGESSVFVDFPDVSLEQTNALLRSQNRGIVSDWVTSFGPETKFSLAINLTICYSTERMEAVGPKTDNHTHIAVHQWNHLNGNWQQKESHIPKDGVATFYTSSFGAFVVMTVPATPVLLEPPKADSSLKLNTIVPAAIAVTCLMLMCACIGVVYRRNRGEKGGIIGVLELRLAKEGVRASEKFQPATDHVIDVPGGDGTVSSSWELAPWQVMATTLPPPEVDVDPACWDSTAWDSKLTLDALGLSLDDSNWNTTYDSQLTLDALGLSLDGASAEDRRPVLFTTRAQVKADASSKSSKPNLAMILEEQAEKKGLTPTTRWALAPSQVAASTLPRNVNVSADLFHVSDARESAVSFDSSRWNSTFDPQLTLDELGLSLDDSPEANVDPACWNSTFDPQLTLDALGLSSDDTVTDASAAIGADSEIGALPMQSLGLTMDDPQGPHVVDECSHSSENIAESMYRRIYNMSTCGNVNVSADLVLVSDVREPEGARTSSMQPTVELSYVNDFVLVPNSNATISMTFTTPSDTRTTRPSGWWRR